MKIEQKFGRNWIIRCCNIIAFLASTKDGNFSLGSTGVFSKWTFYLNEHLKI